MLRRKMVMVMWRSWRAMLQLPLQQRQGRDGFLHRIPFCLILPWVRAVTGINGLVASVGRHSAESENFEDEGVKCLHVAYTVHFFLRLP